MGTTRVTGCTLIVAGLVLIGLGTVVRPVTAAFPGQNGQFLHLGGDGVYTMNPDGSGLAKVPGTSITDSEPQWAHDGVRIATGGSGNGQGIAVFNRDGTGRSTVTSPPSSAFDRVPTWAPDGDRIAFQRVGGSSPGIYILNLGTGATSFLVAGEAPRWSPDGTKIAYLTGASPGDRALYTISPNGGTPGLVVAFAGDESISSIPSWSPNSARLTYARQPNSQGVDGASVYVVDADGTDKQQITEGTGERLPVWSPDGSKIAYHDDGALRTMNPDGTNQQTVVANSPVLVRDWAIAVASPPTTTTTTGATTTSTSSATSSTTSTSTSSTTTTSTPATSTTSTTRATTTSTSGTSPTTASSSSTTTPPATSAPAGSGQSTGAASLSASTVVPGGTMTAAGDGFRSRSFVDGTVFSDPVHVGTTTAGPDGIVRLTFTVPATLTLGRHTVQLRGVDPAGQQRVLSATFTVTRTLPVTGRPPVTALGVGTLVAGLMALALAHRRADAWLAE